MIDITISEINPEAVTEITDSVIGMFEKHGLTIKQSRAMLKFIDEEITWSIERGRIGLAKRTPRETT